ncbi:hypothetical protein KIPB_011508, partial [Kipferlia bialata]
VLGGVERRDKDLSKAMTSTAEAFRLLSKELCKMGDMVIANAAELKKVNAKVTALEAENASLKARLIEGETRVARCVNRRAVGVCPLLPLPLADGSVSA